MPEKNEPAFAVTVSWEMAGCLWAVFGSFFLLLLAAEIGFIAVLKAAFSVILLLAGLTVWYCERHPDPTPPAGGRDG